VLSFLREAAVVQLSTVHKEPVELKMSNPVTSYEWGCPKSIVMLNLFQHLHYI